MNRFTTGLVGGVVLAFNLAACEGEVPTPVGSPIPSTAAAALSGAAVTNIYFGIGNSVPLGSTPQAAEIKLLAGAIVDIEAATADSSLLEFNVFRERRDGTVEMVSPVWAPSGFHLGTFTADSDGLFLFIFPPHADTCVAIALACEGPGTCTNAGQPDASCVAASDCDTALVCARPIGVCNVALSMGVCTVIGPSCSLQPTPVCGCDGSSYATECAALANGVAVQAVGACATSGPP